MKDQHKSAHQASSTGTFLRGFRSGAINSGVMLGIFSVIGFAASAIATGGLAAAAWPLGWTAAIITTLTTGIFSGAMGVKKAKETKAGKSPEAETRTAVLVPTRTPVLASSVDLAESPEMELRNDWAVRTGRGANTQNAVQQILANGLMSDKDRASAILAARENNANSTSIA